MTASLPQLGDSKLLRSFHQVERLSEYLEVVTFDAESVIVREGERDRDMYFVLDGDARIVRGDIDVGGVGAGDHFGELSLIAARPRAASVVARTPIFLARMSLSRFEELRAESPAIALEFVELIISGLGDWLTGMTDTVNVLLHERSLPRRTKVTVRIGGELRGVQTGTPLRDLLPAQQEGQLVVAGLIDRRPEPLTSRVSSDASLEPLSTSHWEGLRIYRTSLGLLLLEAAAHRFPGLELRLEHSIGFAQHVTLGGEVPALEVVVSGLTEAMSALVAENHPLRDELWTTEEARAHFEQIGWNGSSQLLHTSRDATVRMASYGNLYTLAEGPLADRTGVLSGFRLLSDDDGLLLVYGPAVSLPADARHADPPSTEVSEAATLISRSTRAISQDHQRWLETLGTTTVGAFNRACIDGDVKQLIRVAEGHQEKCIAQIADEIASRSDTIKLVTIAGPSSSGKTTFIKRLKVQLTVAGVQPIDISLDDYYCDRDKTPLDEDGEYDFEAFEAIQADLLADHLQRLVAGERVETAHFDFPTGKSHPDGGPTIELHGHELLMMEGIHGLNPRSFENIAPERVFRIFLCPLAQLPFDRLNRLRASDLRLLRRIVRDRHGRGIAAAETITRWPSVRRGERRHIFPFQKHADAVFDSSLIYEPSVLKVYAERYLLEIPQSHVAYTTAFRLLRLLDRFVTIYPDTVPPTSILREFIGGSGFTY